jgi:hypothetical protein
MKGQDVQPVRSSVDATDLRTGGLRDSPAQRKQQAVFLRTWGDPVWLREHGADYTKG